ncbi:11-beta-hydroxysteroid dehydrogenase 1A-like isoform X1 [Actinidia eriantha]|uniref:11-beta-hydroxysteroid dehydrogenase 1A-like isoform X1 n=2 Tax=Actinidia eriantha TaxID=165200 RepID=UPI00258C7B53|nr:11-beta-hydroxysteroid dehydrogenase 1A-like isoform X1 [Actinidia eriantha]
MDRDFLIHAFINAIINPLLFISSCFILPPFFFFKFVGMIIRCFCSERMKGKVVLITGASSGIGEQLAYEYAKKGASLVIVARRENQLQKVAETARELGSPDVLYVSADVSNVDDCKRFVDEAINHFGRLDHLVNNAGINSVCKIEDATDITKFVPVMDINFWGNVYPTYFAIPHLKKTRGKIVVNSSASALLPPPRLSFYAASKAALISFYETMRVELAPSISITVLTLGFIESEMTQGKHLSGDGVIQVDRALVDVIKQGFPVMSSRTCAKAIVDAVCRGERYVTEPKWYRPFFMLKALCPELIEWYCRTVDFYSKSKLSDVDASGSVGSVPPSQKF